MQSNNDFSIGGSLSVNAHGWPAPFGPLATTVRRFRIMLADGSVQNCSPTENAELFRLALGGYGLFGIVIDAELAMVENALLTHRARAARRRATAAAASGERRRPVGADAVWAAVGGAREFSARRAAGGLLPARRGSRPSCRRSSIRRPMPWSRENCSGRRPAPRRGKQARWLAETRLTPRIGQTGLTRNTLLDSPVAALADRDPARTDILHEYFLPPERFDDFLAACREIIPAHRQDLLNVTLRFVEPDPISVLSLCAGAPDRRGDAVRAADARQRPTPTCGR